MPGSTSDEVLRPSILDRLIGGRERSATRQDVRIGVRELKSAVRRDVEWLLNTKGSLLDDLEKYPEASRSILAYGIPDLTIYSSSSVTDQQRLRTVIEEAVRRYEPRLVPHQVKVEYIAASADEPKLQMRFRIRGILHVEPVREPVTFDTNVELDSGNIEILAAD